MVNKGGPDREGCTNINKAVISFDKDKIGSVTEEHKLTHTQNKRKHTRMDMYTNTCMHKYQANDLPAIWKGRPNAHDRESQFTWPRDPPA